MPKFNNGSFYVSGVEVKFPKTEVYPQQKAIMCKVINALNKSENALIESPTGTGKTLALLCGALSWQDQQLERMRMSEIKLPKIYYASRTHKQNTQVIRELKKTAFRDVNMALLGSRQQMCINDKVKNEKNCDDACKELLKNGGEDEDCGCIFFRKVKSYEKQRPSLRSILYDYQKVKNVHSTVFDIEELVKFGEDKQLCPYFGSKMLLIDARIIFCPYSYLIDPFIPERMKLNLENSIIIIDEAHNIEQHCRDVATFAITEQELNADIKAFQFKANYSESDPISIACRRFAELFQAILSFIDQRKETMNDWKEQSYNCHVFKKMLVGEEIVQQLQIFGINQESFKLYQSDMEKINAYIEKFNAKKNGARKTIQTKLSLVSLEKILKFCQYVFVANRKFDYRLGLTKTEIKEKKRSWTVISLNMWCMNPAVAFSSVHSKAHSIILASGTLSPLETFKSELGVRFDHQLQNSHILPANRMLIRSIGMGPNKIPLTFTFKDKTDAMLDELGDLLLRVCSVVPRGVLCFLPSYSLLNTLSERWREDETFWSKLNDLKKVVIEPRIGGEEEIIEYKSVVKNPVGENCTGALFLAVYRGKIAEGLDFEDDYARIVICVGIPYPPLKDLEVEMKREYNKKFWQQNGLLSDNKWYETQAFRAVNQALGRCLRHRNDWASLLLVDTRYHGTDGNGDEKRKQLSKWVREQIQHNDNFGQIYHEIKDFTLARTNEDNDVIEEENVDPVAASTPILSNSFDETENITNCLSSLNLNNDTNLATDLSSSTEILNNSDKHSITENSIELQNISEIDSLNFSSKMVCEQVSPTKSPKCYAEFYNPGAPCSGAKPKRRFVQFMNASSVEKENNADTETTKPISSTKCSQKSRNRNKISCTIASQTDE